MTEAKSQKQLADKPMLRCHRCGEMYHYVFLPSATLAFCPFAVPDRLDEAMELIQQEQLLGRVDISCKDHKSGEQL
ncbi:hypothetical protein MD588_25290 [Photobacterium sp. SDRW27]|uniref:hypothetical protein n=1 Tax=Photobacterium obscurum TaxID=2829490 RepID=UPI002242F726|nr:hypothetical protein [Photobacterium obscurum]MCW8332111.1 hypothetical protein [Photobacterium obscurum]